MHAGDWSELLDNPKLSRITDDEMKKLMIGASAKLAELLKLKETDSEAYWRQIDWFCDSYTRRWNKDEPI